MILIYARGIGGGGGAVVGTGGVGTSGVGIRGRDILDGGGGIGGGVFGMGGLLGVVGGIVTATMPGIIFATEELFGVEVLRSGARGGGLVVAVVFGLRIGSFIVFGSRVGVIFVRVFGAGKFNKLWKADELNVGIGFWEVTINRRRQVDSILNIISIFDY